jgi:chromosome segregation ATPase
MDVLGDATGEAGQSIEDAVNGMYGSVDAAYAVEEALFKVGESLFENGDDFSAYSEAGRANMDAVAAAVNAMAKSAGDDTALFTSNVAGLLAQLQSAGIDTGNELAWIGDMLNDLTGRQYGIDFNSSAARKDILSFIETSIKALQVRAQLERERIAAVNAANEQARVSASVFSSGGTPAPMRLAPAPDKTELNSLNQSIKAMQNLYSSAQKAATATGSVANGAKSAGTSMQQGYDKGAAAAKRAADKTKEAADRTKEMQQEVRTLEDYANDLSGVFNRVTDLMFGLQEGRDNIQNALGAIRDHLQQSKRAIRDAREAVGGLRSDLKDARLRVKELGAELLSLRADKKVLQYQLTVAVAYGDDLRAAEIRGELAEKNAEISKTEKERADASKEVSQTLKELRQAQRDVQKAVQDASRALTGNSRAARENRQRVNELLNSYKQQIVTAAANGATTGELARLTDRLSREFADQLKQMGYNRTEVNRYRSAFTEFTKTINKVPRKVTVKATASTSPAQRALNEFIAKNRNRSVNVKVNTPKVGSISGGTIRPSGISVGGAGISTPKIKTGTTEANKFNALNFNAYQGPTRAIRRANGGKVDYLASGGVGGLHPGAPRGTDTVPAWLTPGEYVHNKSAVNHYGLPFMNAINSLQFPKYLATGSGGVSGGSATGPALVELMPRQLAQLAQMVSTQVVLDGKIVAQATNDQNRNSSIRKVN